LGEDQFIGGQALGNMTFPRAQHDFAWSGSDVWTVSYDFCAHYNGTGTAMDNLGSFSLQDSNTARYFIALNTWATPGSKWNANYSVFDGSGQPPGGTTMNAGPAWMNLDVDHWYRQSTTFDFVANRIMSVTIIDLETGDSSTATPDSWFLAGGFFGGGLPLPTALRFFVGGGTGSDAGNVMGWDNLDIEAGAAPVALDESAKPQPIKVSPTAVTH
jgi:hypothetical protein